MSKYRVLYAVEPFVVECESVAFNLEYNMIFFNDEDKNTVASCRTDVPFYKLKDDEKEEVDDN